MKVSIIIPVYNREKTIEKCLKSIMQQSYKNIEIIVVDDGSQDQSVQIIKKLANLDSRILLKTKENEGVSKTRNVGIQMANGDFIVFVDSDDYIDSNMIEEMISTQEKENFDLVFCGYISERGNQTIPSFCENTSATNKHDCLKNLLEAKKFHLFAAPFGKLYKTSIIKENNLHFIEALSLGEDTCFVLSYFQFVTSLCGLSNCYYHCVVNDASLSRSNHADIWDSQQQIYSVYKELFSTSSLRNVLKKKDFLFFRGVRVALNTAIKYNWEKKDFFSLCKQIVTDDNFSKSSVPSSLYFKVLYYLLKYRFFSGVAIIIKLKNRGKRLL